MVGIYHKYRTFLDFSDTVSVQFCRDMHLIVFFGQLFSVLLFCVSLICVCIRGNMDSIAIYILQKFLGNMDIDSKPFRFRRKGSILHRNMQMHIARRKMCIAIKNCSMHIAIKKSETSSPNE